MNTYQTDNYKIWLSQPLSQDLFSKKNDEEKLIHFCLAAHLSPSSHNTQPWRFKLNAKRMSIEVMVDEKSILPASDINGRQTAISIGCCLKNMEVAAGFFGYGANFEIINKDKKNLLPGKEEKSLIPLLEVSFKPTQPDNSQRDKYESIFRRQVTRAEYDEQTPIPAEIMEKIKNIKNSGIKIHLVQDRMRRLMIGEFQGQADNFVINSKKFSQELGEWLLPNDTNSHIGMPGITFGLDDNEADRLHRGLKGEQALKPEDGLKFSLGGKIGIEKSPAVCFLTSENDEIESWLEAGKVMEEIFLELTASQIGFTVHAGIAEVSLINKLFSMSMLGTTSRILTLFRFGYVKKEADKLRPHSPRLPLTDVIVLN